jgi:hypothetical protein
MKKPRVNFTFTRRAKRLLEELALREGMSQSAYLEMMIRETANRLKIVLPPETVETESDEDEGDEP